MWIKASVEGPDGRLAEDAADVQVEGELATVISKAIGEYRKLYPDAEPFDYTIRISHT